jgi:hypothetical protein
MLLYVSKSTKYVYFFVAIFPYKEVSFYEKNLEAFIFLKQTQWQHILSF